MTILALPLVAAGSIQVSLANAAVIENTFSPGVVLNISPETTGCPRAGSSVDRRDAWSRRWRGACKNSHKVRIFFDHLIESLIDPHLKPKVKGSAPFIGQLNIAPVNANAIIWLDNHRT